MNILFVNISRLEPTTQSKIYQVHFVLVLHAKTNQQISSLGKKNHFYTFEFKCLLLKITKMAFLGKSFFTRKLYNCINHSLKITPSLYYTLIERVAALQLTKTVYLNVFVDIALFVNILQRIYDLHANFTHGFVRKPAKLNRYCNIHYLLLMEILIK